MRIPVEIPLNAPKFGNLNDTAVISSPIVSDPSKMESEEKLNLQPKIKKTSFYLRHARYKPGVNLAQMLKNKYLL